MRILGIFLLILCLVCCIAATACLITAWGEPRDSYGMRETRRYLGLGFVFAVAGSVLLVL